MPKHASYGWTHESLLHATDPSLSGRCDGALWTARHLGTRAWQSVRMTDSPTTAPHDLRRWPSDPGQLTDTALCPACFAPLTSARC